jgi:hypothetical protein
LEIERTLTSLEIQNLFATPIELIPNPGVGKLIVPLLDIMFYDFASIPYANGGNLVLKYGTLPANKIITTVLDSADLNQPNDVINFSTSFYPSVDSIASNSNLVITNFTAPFINGDGTLKIYIRYLVYTL